MITIKFILTQEGAKISMVPSLHSHKWTEGEESLARVVMGAYGLLMALGRDPEVEISISLSQLSEIGKQILADSEHITWEDN